MRLEKWKEKGWKKMEKEKAPKWGPRRADEGRGSVVGLLGFSGLAGGGVVADMADDEEIVEFASVAIEAVLADEKTEVGTPRGRIDLVMWLTAMKRTTDFDGSSAINASCLDRCGAVVWDPLSDLRNIRDGFLAGHLKPGFVDCCWGDDRRTETFFRDGLVMLDRIERCDAAGIFSDVATVNGVVEEAGGRGVGRQYGRMAEIVTWEVVEMDCAV